ncbi:unnamed protein product [Withania somnifera]
MKTKLHLLLLFCLSCYLSLSNGTQLLIVNNCKESVWPGILGTAGHETPSNGGFHLKIGQQVVIQLPDLWSGRIWGRQGCCFDKNGKGSCQTGDCSGLLHCSGAGGTPFDGFNIPVAMIPIGGSAGCGVAACEADLNECCPAYLAVKCQGKIVGCKSACLATNSPKYCCTGEFANKNTCKPTAFSQLFKTICPRAYSYAFDESTGLKSCKAPRYLITFCPPN